MKFHFKAKVKVVENERLDVLQEGYRVINVREPRAWTRGEEVERQRHPRSILP